MSQATDYAESFCITDYRPTLSGIPSGGTPPQSSFPSTPDVRPHQPNAKPVHLCLVPSSSRSERLASTPLSLVDGTKTRGRRGRLSPRRAKDWVAGSTPVPAALGSSRLLLYSRTLRAATASQTVLGVVCPRVGGTPAALQLRAACPGVAARLGQGAAPQSYPT